MKKILIILSLLTQCHLGITQINIILTQNGRLMQGYTIYMYKDSRREPPYLQSANPTDRDGKATISHKGQVIVRGYFIVEKGDRRYYLSNPTQTISDQLICLELTATTSQKNTRQSKQSEAHKGFKAADETRYQQVLADAAKANAAKQAAEKEKDAANAARISDSTKGRGERQLLLDSIKNLHKKLNDTIAYFQYQLDIRNTELTKLTQALANRDSLHRQDSLRMKVEITLDKIHFLMRDCAFVRGDAIVYNYTYIGAASIHTVPSAVVTNNDLFEDLFTEISKDPQLSIELEVRASTSETRQRVFDVVENHFRQLSITTQIRPRYSRANITSFNLFVVRRR